MAVFGETKTGLAIRGGAGWFWGLLTTTVAVLAIVVVVVSGVADKSETVGSVETNHVSVAPAPESLLSSEEIVTVRLANAGLIPMAAVDWETIELKKAVARGWVPEQALQPASMTGETVFTQEELATIDLASRGLIPTQTVDWDDVALKQLVSRGLVPKAARP